jgi:hypothetical protein
MKRLLHLLKYEPEIVAYSILGTSIGLTFGLETFAPGLAKHLYEYRDPTDADVDVFFEECAKLNMDPFAVQPWVVHGEEAFASVNGWRQSVLFIPEDCSQAGIRRAEKSLNRLNCKTRTEAFETQLWMGAMPKTEAEVRVLMQLELMGLARNDARREYILQAGTLGVLGGAVILLRRKHVQNILLSITPLIGTLAIQRIASHQSTRSSFAALDEEQRTTLRSYLQDLICFNQTVGKKFGMINGNDYLDFAKPLLSSRIKMMD